MLTLLLIGLVITQPAHAAGFVVNSTADTDDGTCDAANCTLREAINAANAMAGTDTITFDATVFTSAATGTITLTSDLPNITTDMNITGLGTDKVIVDGNNLHRPFYIPTSGTFVTVSDLTITRGNTSGDGGGILNYGALTVSSSVFSSNTTHSGTGGGGGIANYGAVTVIKSAFSGNTATARDGGGIYNATTLKVTNSTFSDNSAGSGGGGIGSNGTTLTVINSTFSGNSATYAGGGVHNNQYTATVINSTLSGNSAGSGGGGGGVTPMAR